MNGRTRNDLCACGSGKKYKKCCYLTASPGAQIHVKQATQAPRLLPVQKAVLAVMTMISGKR